jgi:hypothetical protein
MAECPILQVLLQLEPSRSISRGKGTKRIWKGRKGSRDRYKKKSFPIEFQWAFYISVGARTHMCACVSIFWVGVGAERKTFSSTVHNAFWMQFKCFLTSHEH